MKFKIKIILTLLILFFSINNVYGEILDEGEFFEESYITRESEHTPYGSTTTMGITSLNIFHIENYPYGFQYLYMDIENAEFVGNLKGTYDSYYEPATLKDGSTVIAVGKIGYYKKTDGKYRIWLWLDTDTWNYAGSGLKNFDLLCDDSDNFRMTFFRSAVGGTDAYTISFGSSWYLPHVYYIDSKYSFKNSFYTNYTGGMSNLYYNKNIVGYEGNSKVKLVNSIGDIIINETSFNHNSFSISQYDQYYPYTLTCENAGNNIFYEKLYFSTPETPYLCRIETNDINIGENINTSYFNIIHLRNNPNQYGDSDYATCNLNIQIIADRGYYEELIYQDLITDETDNIFYYSSDTLSSGIYYAQINKELGSLNDYAVRNSFFISDTLNYSIVVNPNDVYVGDNINIIYKSLNQSTLSIYDNSSTLIKQYLNIENEGQKIFQIPPDYIYENTYPNWYVYLNDTGNSSNNLKYNFTVKWRVYTEIEPTPQPTDSYYNESIEENIEQIKDGINPIKELIFGLSTIFVDNPDYNDDNVVDVNEISTWLNSLIGIAIVIFLFILYTVYKRG